ncbi:unnamed protein product [Rotaria sp. Silwood1]|nr:unnamed protein product [Rotaria sp. Silwood1]CAF1481362.1 unnamed protein product [Rotaria sp. Silwood1]CAF3551062.1 unnamed protein product [Rotaria sp. Silwood1]CAF3578397.1 unnamed protein product [Rotaria sp. Silwood1]CAF3583847.1 unnamed protein product [Rotaria sp. Silwood1]
MPDILHSVIERLSVELWQEIFEYLNLNDLWYSFRGLNSRIDAIIDQTSIHVNFKNGDDYDYLKKNILSSINIASIQSLKLRRINEIKHFFSIYSLSSLTQLRLLSLTLRYSFNDKFRFWDQLSSLKNLRLLEVKFWNIAGPNNCIQEKEYIIRSIFNKGCCPLLESLIIGTCGIVKIMAMIPLLMRTDSTTNIKRLFIDSLTFYDLMKLRPAIQNVQSFCPDYQLDYSTTSPMLLKCIQLKVQLSRDFMFEHVEYLLQQTPNLEELILSGWYHLLDAKKWELLLSTQCPKLIKFELICLGDVYDNSFKKAADNFEQEYNITLFWLKRNTIVRKDRSRCSFCCRFDVVA